MKGLSKIFLLSKTIILIYVTIVLSIFYHDLKNDNKILDSVDVDATGITSFTLLGLYILFSFYQIHKSFSSKS